MLFNVSEERNNRKTWQLMMGNNLENNTLYARKALLQCFMSQPWKSLPIRLGQNDQENRRHLSITDL